MGFVIFPVLTFILISFPASKSQSPGHKCPCTKPPICKCLPEPQPDTDVLPERCKRATETTQYPHPGTWYKVTENGIYYFLLGRTVYVQRSDRYYSEWVNSGNGSDWALNDNYLWKWDKQGRWYPHEGGTNAEDGSDDCTKLKIPIKCIGPECPDQVRFPSNGVWYILGEKVIFQQDGGPRYELQNNGLYQRFEKDKQGSDKAGGKSSWSWNFTSGVWCQTEEGASEREEVPSPPK